MNNLADKKAVQLLKKIPGNIYTLIVITLVFWICCKPGTFMTGSNLINTVRQCSFLAIVSIGSLLAIITGGIDLSVGGTMCFSGVVAAVLASKGQPMVVVVVVAVLAGTLIGALNGIIIAKNKVAPFIITLATWNVADSLALVTAGGATVTVENPDFRFLGGSDIGFLPVCVIVALLVYILFYIITRRTKTGTYIYAIGGNETAAHLTGINVAKIKFLVYTFSGFTAALAGVLLASRLGSANPGQGDGYEFYGIASAVVAGASMAGGNGTVWNTLIGALVITILRSGLNIAGIPNSWQMVVLGVVIVGVVFIDVMSRRKQR